MSTYLRSSLPVTNTQSTQAQDSWDSHQLAHPAMACRASASLGWDNGILVERMHFLSPDCPPPVRALNSSKFHVWLTTHNHFEKSTNTLGWVDLVDPAASPVTHSTARDGERTLPTSLFKMVLSEPIKLWLIFGVHIVNAETQLFEDQNANQLCSERLAFPEVLASNNKNATACHPLREELQDACQGDKPVEDRCRNPSKVSSLTVLLLQSSHRHLSKFGGLRHSTPQSVLWC